jgi:hypothetical protein
MRLYDEWETTMGTRPCCARAAKGVSTQTAHLADDSFRASRPWSALLNRRRSTAGHEESLRRDLKLDVLNELWANAKLSEIKAFEQAVEAQHATRPRRRASGARGR